METTYIHTEDVHNTKAAKVVVPLILDLVPLKSILDVGCGIGTWLKVFIDYGINDFLGVDGDYVNRNQLQIENTHFISHDLTTPLSLKREFDLVLSLEVAEHLPKNAANAFVESLVTHGKTILFSAAIPGQGGQNHLNEQWPEYWMAKFAKHGYFFHDVIRPLIWENSNVDYWYRQNIFLVNKKSNSGDNFKSVVHPHLFNKVLNNQIEYKNSLMKGQQGVKLAFKIFYNSLLYKIGLNR